MTAVSVQTESNTSRPTTGNNTRCSVDIVILFIPGKFVNKLLVRYFGSI